MPDPLKDKDVRRRQRFENFRKAFAQLSSAAALTEQRDLTDLEQQGLIQTFECTHELAWNTLKDFLESRGTSNIFGSKDATREAFAAGLKAWVVALDRDHCVIDNLADGWLLRAALEIGPARGGWDPEDVLGAVFVGIFWIAAGVFAFARDKLRVMFLEAVGDVLEEDKPEYNVLVFRRVHV